MYRVAQNKHPVGENAISPQAVKLFLSKFRYLKGEDFPTSKNYKKLLQFKHFMPFIYANVCRRTL